ncbi:DMT family transporter [Salmonella enterica]|nr:DMT family transporter [Salmonella enterica]EHW8943637.1 DMT family transporter [Salmonella enterica]ELP9210024.1 DMT family transporter [Salmonella enterica]EMB3956430.1 DMT family transporter [Salmonella enterica]EMB3959582.1 DMT family transporter [Salmonella enterica]
MKKDVLFINVYLKLVFVAFFWGASTIAGKIALQYSTPAIVIFFRFFIATIIMLPILWIKKEPINIELRSHIKSAIISLAGVSFCYYLYFNGLNLSSAFNAGVIEAITPLVTVLFAFLLNMERINSYQISGLILAYLGVLMTITKGNWNILTTSDYNTGDILLLLSTFCFGAYNILTKRWQININPNVFMFYFFLYGCLTLSPWLIYSGWKDFYNEMNKMFNPAPLAAEVFMALCGSVMAYLFFNEGIAKIGVSKTSSFINLVPLITALLSVYLLDEIANIYQWTGAAIILAGVFLSNKQVVKHSS